MSTYTASQLDKQVVFIQNDIPPLRDGVYTLRATHTVPNQDPGSFSAASSFVVQGERFALAATEIDAVFPPNLANGEFDGVLPHVTLTRCTLPWERGLDTPHSAHTYPQSPWLAVLVCDNSDQQPAPLPIAATAKDLVPVGTTITVTGSSATGQGTLPASKLSYGAALLSVLGYGETPDDACSVIDLPVDLFNQVAPAAADLAYLAHVREVDTLHGPDTDADRARSAVVVANRTAPSNGAARAYLVSLEGMADYLPSASGQASPLIDSRVKQVRLLVYRSWTFTANNLDQTLSQLLSNLNAPGPDGVRVTTPCLPAGGPPPSAARLAAAMAAQASGQASADDAAVLMRNALLMGYVPMNHHLRHGGKTVSFYRGPLSPLPVPAASAAAYYNSPDAANAYNPYTGLFDVSYGAAWQLGQLMALQSAGMANQLYAWKRSVTQQQAMAAEQQLLAQRLQGAPLFQGFMSQRAALLRDGPPPLPDEVADWFSNLATLQGIPFSYLVPDERMLPPESIRFFWLDSNWMDALIDGAFSIGRAGVSPQSIEARHAPSLRAQARMGMGLRAANRRRALHAAGIRAGQAPVTGCLIRSQAIAGWPKLRILGFADAKMQQALPALRIARLSDDTVLCLFNGELVSLCLREPPEQQHHGVEGMPDALYTTLRAVSGGPDGQAPGQQYTSNPKPFVSPCDPGGKFARACLSVRADGRTLDVAGSAGVISLRLTRDFSQKLPSGFTSAEYALEMTKGVVEVEYLR